jgi:phage-related protein
LAVVENAALVVLLNYDGYAIKVKVVSAKQSVDIRSVIFVNKAAHRAFDELPEHVRLSAEVLLTALQNNRPLPSKRFECLKGVLNGITELKIPDDTNTYRIYDLVEFGEVIYLLDAGIKKSNEQGEIPAWQTNTLVERKKAAKIDYAENKELYKAEFDERKTRRTEAQQAVKPRGVRWLFQRS